MGKHQRPKTESKKTANAFMQLPYKKKVCFVPFKTEESTLCYVDCYDEEKKSSVELGRKVNSMAQRSLLYYDDVDLLYEGKIRKISEYR